MYECSKSRTYERIEESDKVYFRQHWLKVKIEPLKNDFKIYFLNGKSDSDFTGDEEEKKSISD